MTATLYILHSPSRNLTTHERARLFEEQQAFRADHDPGPQHLIRHLKRRVILGAALVFIMHPRR